MKRVLALLLSLLLLASCSSFGDLVRSQVDGLPSWVHTPPARGDQRAFVGTGSATVAYNARLAAYEDLLSQISAYVGEDIKPAYYRELTTTDHIADFNLAVTGEHQRTEKGKVYVYVLARLDATLLAARQTTTYRKTLEREERIAALIATADSAYRANDDTRAIACYLEAAAIAAEGPVVEKKHESAALAERAIGYIKALRISFRRTDQKPATVTVQVRRRRRLLSSRVVNATVRASYEAFNSLGESYDDYLLFNTTTVGSFAFIAHNQLIAVNEPVTFSLDFSDLFERVPPLPEALAERVREALEQVSVQLPYERSALLAVGSLYAEIQQYSLAGSPLVDKLARSAFISTFERLKTDLNALSLAATDRDDQVIEIARRLDSGQRIFVGSVGVVAEDWAYDQAIVVAVGRLELYEIGSDGVLFDSGDVEAVGFGSTIEQARTQAFERFGTIAASRCLSYLFTF